MDILGGSNQRSGQCVGLSVSETQEMLKKRRISLESYRNSSLPILHSLDYYVQPSLEELVSKEISDAGYCSRVPDFVVGRTGYGHIMFYGETDVRLLDLERIVKFDRHKVVVYENENDKPLVGQGLNKTAEVTIILHLKSRAFQDQEKIVGKLKSCTERQGAHFISFNYLSGEWKFLVQHFSRFGLADDEDEEEDMAMDEGDVVQKDEAEGSGSGGFPDDVVLSHSLPAHLGLDPLKMHEMRMLMFPDEDRDDGNDFDGPFPHKRFVGTEYAREASPSYSAKRSFHQSSLQDSMKKTLIKASPLRKTPHALLDYHMNDSDTGPSQSMFLTKQIKALPLRKMKAEGFKLDTKNSTPFSSFSSNNVVDAALFMGKSFRVGWGPNGILVHSGSPVRKPGCQLSSVINIERVAFDRVVRDEDNKVNEELIDMCFVAPLNLHKSMDHKYEDIKVDSFNIKLQKVVASRFYLSMICQDYIRIIENQVEITGLSSPTRLIRVHQVMVWDLIKVLFQERQADEQLKSPLLIDDDGEEMMLDKKDISLDVDAEAKPYVRRADFSLWLQDSVCHRVQEEVSCLDGSNDLEQILLLLTGRQLDAAVELAASRGDVRLAILLAQCGGSMMNRRDMARQLDLWRNNGLDFNFVERDRLKLYEILSGNVEGALCDFSIDWKRYMGLVTWFQLPPDTPLPIIIQTFNHLLSEGRAPQPVPIYVDEGPAGEIVNLNQGDRYDLAYYLMLLHADENKPNSFLKIMFSAFSSTFDPLDYHMIWHQRAILEAIGAISSDDLYVLDMNFISQLLCLGQCHWAIYVALHMPYHKDFPYLQTKLIKEILTQYCETWSANESQCEFIKDLGVPYEWMHEAQATFFQYYGDLPKALEHFIESYNWQKAHSIFMTSVAHTLFLASQHSEIKRLANSMEANFMEIANWDLGAAVFMDFYDLKCDLQEKKNVFNQGSLEKMTEACKDFFTRLDESLFVWGSKMPLHATARVVYSSMVDQLSKLLVSIQGGSAYTQMRCFDTILGAPVPEDVRSSHLQDAVSVFTYYISEGAS